MHGQMHLVCTVKRLPTIRWSNDDHTAENIPAAHLRPLRRSTPPSDEPSEDKNGQAEISTSMMSVSYVVDQNNYVLYILPPYIRNGVKWL